MIIQYDGTDFYGWQVQAKGRTVQGDIESAFQTILPDQKITLIGSGRTDSGVHAMKQTANIKIDTRFSSDEIRKAINSHLERDVRIAACEEVDTDFHARFSATNRRYQYQTVREYTPFTRNRAWHLNYEIDPTILNACAEMVIGDHDFTAFCKANAEVEHKRCIFTESKWEKTATGFIYHVAANRFLQHMVRFLVGTMVEVARGRMTIDDFKQFMNAKHDSLAVVRAPAMGLYLSEVEYA